MGRRRLPRRRESFRCLCAIRARPHRRLLPSARTPVLGLRGPVAAHPLRGLGVARAISHADGKAALARWKADPVECPRSVTATAVRYTLAELQALYPGRSVEVRVPPFGAVQILEGTHHRRGTPPAVVEMKAPTWLDLALGNLAWSQAQRTGVVTASGQRTDLGHLLPLPAL